MKKINLLLICIIVLSTFGCGNKNNNILETSKKIIDKDFADCNIGKCYYYDDENAIYVKFFSMSNGEDDAVILLDDNTVFYGSEYSKISKDDYDKIIEYGDYALYSTQVAIGDEDWVEVKVE